MDLSNRRQRLALAALTLAGLAVMATSGPSYYLREAISQSEVGVESEWMSGIVSAPKPERGRGFLSIVLDDRGLDGDAAVAAEGRLRLADEPIEGIGWQPLPMERIIPGSLCGEASLCSVGFEFQVRPPVAMTGPLVIQWTIEARVETGPSFTLKINDRTNAPSAGLIGLLGGILGLSLGVAAGLFASRVQGDRQRLVLALTAMAAALVALAVVVEGALIQNIAPTLAVVGAICFAPLLLAFLRRRVGQARGEVLAVGLISVPVLLGVFGDQGIYRVVDIAAVLMAAGGCIALGVVLLWITRDRDMTAVIRTFGTKQWSVVLMSLGLITLIAFWTLNVAAGNLNYPLGYIIVPLVAAVLLAWALWRWLHGSVVLMVAVGLALPVAALLGWLAAGLPYSFTPDRAPDSIYTSLIAIGLGGVALAAFGLSSLPSESTSGAE